MPEIRKTRPRQVLALLLAALLSVPVPVRAEEAKSPDDAAVELPAVSVTDTREDAPTIAPTLTGKASQGYRVSKINLGPLGDTSTKDLPLSVDVVSSELIANTQATNTVEALKYVPTVYANTGSSQITPYMTIRGFSVSPWTYNMALDGMRSFDIYEPLEDKDRIEVLRGGTGFLYGITAPGGMINYVTKQPTDKPFHEITLGSYDEQLSGHLDLGGPITEESKTFYRLNLAYANPGDTGVDHQTMESHDFSAVVEKRFDRGGKLFAEASHSARDLDYAQSLFMTTTAIGIPKAPDASKNWGADYDDTKDSTTRLGLGLETPLSDVLSLRTRYRYTDISREFTLSRMVFQNKKLDYKWREDSNDEFHYFVNQYNAFLDANFETGLLGHKLSAGVSWDDCQVGDNGARSQTFTTLYSSTLYGTPYAPAYRLPAAGTTSSRDTTYKTFILSDQIKIGSRWGLLLAATHAGVDDKSTSTTTAGVSTTTHYDESRVSPALGLTFKPIEPLTTYVSYSEALEQGMVAGSTTANAGETFAPYVSHQYEAGAKATLGRVDLAAAYFYIEKANQYVDTTTNVASQDGREVHQGVELSATGSLTDRLRLTGGYTRLEAEITKAAGHLNEGKTPQGVPEEMARLFAEYDLPFLDGLTVIGGLSYIGRVPWDAANTLYVDQVTLVDAGLRYQREIMGYKSTFRLNVANLTGEDYWTTRSGILYLGSPRTVTLSASLVF